MKSVITVIILCAAAICAPAHDEEKEKCRPSPSGRSTIPKDAVQNPDGDLRLYGQKRQEMDYVKTPFRVMKTWPGYTGFTDRRRIRIRQSLSIARQGYRV